MTSKHNNETRFEMHFVIITVDIIGVNSIGQEQLDIINLQSYELHNQLSYLERLNSLELCGGKDYN